MKAALYTGSKYMSKEAPGGCLKCRKIFWKNGILRTHIAECFEIGYDRWDKMMRRLRNRNNGKER